MTAPTPEQPDERIVRDKRRVHVDPVTGAVPTGTAPEPGGSGAQPGGSGAQPGGGFGNPTVGGDVTSVEVTQLRTEVAERTADLQRLHAEYANYRKRVERDREAVRETAVAGALANLLPVLDDIGRARDHGELEGGFKQVAESLEAVVAKLGLRRYGSVGDEFDPTVHEALMHAYSDEVDRPTCVQILQPGYAFGERVVRAARVAVAEPTAPLPTTEEGSTDE